MRETQRNSSGNRLTVEQLLQLKRSERPGPDFWIGFERELQQKQLQALVRPSSWTKVRMAFSLPRQALGSLSALAAGGVAVLVVGFSFYASTGASLEVVASHSSYQRGDTLLVAEAGEHVFPEEPREVEAESSPRRTDAFFVVDALRPGRSTVNAETFRTKAVPETFTAVSDSSAYYVTNVFTAAGLLSAGAMTLEF